MIIQALPAFLLSFLHMAAIFGARPIISLYASRLGMGAAEIGLIFAVFNFVQLGVAVGAGYLADRWGTRVPALLGSVLLIAGAAITASAESFGMILVGQAVSGMAHIAVLVSYQTQLGNMPNREYQIGWMSMFVAGGQALGPTVAGLWADRWGLVPTLWVMVGMAVVATLPAFFMSRAGGSRGEETHRTDWGVLRQPHLMRALAVSVSVLFSVEMFSTYFPLYAEEVGLSVGAIGMIMTARALASMLPRFLMGTILHRFGRRRALIGTFLFGGAAISMFSVVHSFWLMLGVAVVVGLALGLAQPMSIVMVAESVARHQRGKVLAIRLMSNRIAQVISPILFGQLASAFGLAPIFMVSGGLLMMTYRAVTGTAAVNESPAAD